MSWCPNCKFEYVDGIKICPDCKTALVDSLEENTDATEEMEEAILPYMDELPDEEERQEILERIKKIKENPPYKYKAEQLEENKSGAVVLLICGTIGVAVLVLNALGVLSIPLKGFSLTLMNAVMGCLFFVFLVTGVMAVVKSKKLKPLVEKEKTDISLITDFIKEKKLSGEYQLKSDDEDYELKYLELSDRVVADVNEHFPDLEPGFAFFVVDRYAGDILDED